MLHLLSNQPCVSLCLHFCANCIHRIIEILNICCISTGDEPQLNNLHVSSSKEIWDNFFAVLFPSFGCQRVCCNLASSKCSCPFARDLTWCGTVFTNQCRSSQLLEEITIQIFILQKSHSNTLTFDCRQR